MSAGPKNPLLYEINTWAWLEELSRQRSHPFTLASVPEEEWDRIAALCHPGCRRAQGVMVNTPILLRFTNMILRPRAT